MILRKLYLALLFAFSFALQLSAQEVSAVLKDRQIKIGEQTQITLQLRATADGKLVQFPSLIDTISGKIEIVEITEIDTAYDENDISIRLLSQTITITSWDSGFHAIPPFLFKIGEDEIQTQAQLIEVKTIPIEAEADIKDIKNIMEVPFSLWDWILVNKLWIGGSILAILIIVLGIILYKRRKIENPDVEAFVPKEEADVLAKQQLEALEAAKLWQAGNVNQYYTQLSHILREYLENRFQISALEKTTDEIDILLNYHKEVEERNRNQFAEFLRLADMAKFAKSEPTAGENEEALKYGYRFVEETKAIIIEVEEQEEESEKENKEAKAEVS